MRHHRVSRLRMREVRPSKTQRRCNKRAREKRVGCQQGVSGQMGKPKGDGHETLIHRVRPLDTLP